jgi:hypothetical protein
LSGLCSKKPHKGKEENNKSMKTIISFIFACAALITALSFAWLTLCATNIVPRHPPVIAHGIDQPFEINLLHEP